jgi:conjugal transfer pilus assembly protein TraB
MNDKSSAALQTQKRIFTALAITLFFIFFGLFYVFLESPAPLKIAEAKIELPSDKINPQDIWMSKVDGEGKLIDQRLKYIEGLILDSKEKEAEKENENRALRQEITKLKLGIKSIAESASAKAQSKDDIDNQVPSQKIEHTSSRRASSDDPFVSNSCTEFPRPIRPQLKELKMESIKKREIMTVDQAIPSGTTVKAILVSSVDAPCAVYSPCDPRPVKLRILDDGHLPQGVLAKIKGGLIIASAYGDISTERVYMRLERLTKVEANGEFVETEIAGFVSGEDGKYGLRGDVVDKSNCLVANATYSGFFSGVSQFLNTTMVASLSEGCCGGLPVGVELLQGSTLQGTSNAFDTLADYYIQRAEQIVPVIEVTAGRIVDITFTHKAELGDLYTQDKVQEIREKSRNSSLCAYRKNRPAGGQTCTSCKRK